MNKHLTFRALILCFALSMTAAVQAIYAQSAAAPAQQKYEDLVHFGDVIDVDVVGGFEFDWRGSLNAEGFLSGLDGLDEPVYGLCRSESEVAAALAASFGRILRDPKVVVRIIDRAKRAPALVVGAIRTPTRFQLRRAVDLAELIVLSGGFLDSANGEISLYRPKDAGCAPPAQDNSSASVNIKISDLIRNREGANPRIFAGDIVTVAAADPIFVTGAVVRPGQIFAREGMTLQRAIAAAGGLATNADGGKVTIFRKDGRETAVIERRVGGDKANSLDERLKPFDIIEVAARGGRKLKYPPEDFAQRAQPAALPLKVVD